MTTIEDELSLTFTALGDPTRRAMLERLSQGDATVNELAAPFAISQQAVSRHVKVLEQAGLISRSRSAQQRPCHFEPDALDVVVEWIDRHRQIWSDRFDRLQDHLDQLRTTTPDKETP